MRVRFFVGALASAQGGVVGVVLAASVLSTSCGRVPTRDVRATIVDEKGAPIPGAIFYAEAYDQDGAFAFLTAVTGEAGEVPVSAREPLKMPWRRGARIALAGFAPGRAAALLRDPKGRVESDGAVLVLGPGAGSESAGFEWISLSFPFENEPELHRRLSAPEYDPLRAAFLSVFEAARERAQAGRGVRSVLNRKIGALRAAGDG